LPCSPHFVAGIINRRGALLTVLDLKKLLFRQSADYQNKNSIIIVSDNQITVGILADQIVGNQYYDLKLLDASLPSENIIKPEFIVGLHQGKVAMLNISAIITESQLQLSKGTVYEHNK
jgi:purine-binding chemotaxis protein CheW